MGFEALKLGWDIAFPPGKANDLNEAFLFYGSIWSINEICCNVPKNQKEAEMMIKINCRKELNVRPNNRI